MDLYATVRSQIEHLEPFVIPGCTDDWKAMRWTRKQLVKIVNPAEKDGFLRIRFGPKEHHRGQILFENESKMAYISSLEQFYQWFLGGEKTTIITADDDGRTTIDRAHYWGYFDYNYVFDVMDPEHIGDINWCSIGIDADPVDSTIWIGTPGAYTPCHCDSYGYNVHAQLSGRKRWILFKPNEDMRPTRIPYEESTIFSSLDVIGADRTLQRKEIRMVTLSKGDVIFIPPGWWHCVQCVGVNDNDEDPDNICVSVNTWIPVDEYDQISRMHEAATSTMITFLNRAGLIKSNHICPSESMLCYDDSLFDFRRVLEEARNKNATDQSLRRLLDFVEKQKSRKTIVPIVSFDDFRAEQEKGPLKIVESLSYAPSLTTCSSSLTVNSFQKHFIDSLLSEKVLGALIVQLQEWAWND